MNSTNTSTPEYRHNIFINISNHLFFFSDPVDCDVLIEVVYCSDLTNSKASKAPFNLNVSTVFTRST